MHSYTRRVTIGGERLRLTASGQADGTLGEVALAWGRYGSSAGGLADAYATAVTTGLEHGIPLAELLEPALGLRFPPSGATDDPEVPRARSVVDYMARRL